MDGANDLDFSGYARGYVSVKEKALGFCPDLVVERKRSWRFL